MSSGGCLTWSLAQTCSTWQPCIDGACRPESPMGDSTGVQEDGAGQEDGAAQGDTAAQGDMETSGDVAADEGDVASPLDTLADWGCQPDCDGLECGSDGCGGSCGTCEKGRFCVEGECSDTCLPDCGGRECGDDGCGGSCGNCPAVAPICTAEGMCAKDCKPACEGKECGDDGCGGSCGKCPAVAPVCNASGECEKECMPQCQGKVCGSDSCGGTCGDECDSGWSCVDGQCIEDCKPDCVGKTCGADGCGGICGECSPGWSCVFGLCTEDCVPDCGGKSCGSDGCGGSCGGCLPPLVCQGGKCVGCGDGSCGGGETCLSCEADCGVCPSCPPPVCNSVLEECLQAVTGEHVCVAQSVKIPAGSFWMGCNATLDSACQGDENPYHYVNIGYGYRIDKTEVTVGQYAACVAAGSCAAITDANCVWGTTTFGKAGLESYAVSCVPWAEAEAYCAWKGAGSHLCTEAEWEKAARGGCELYGDCQKESRVWPWGNTFPSSCNGKVAVYEGCKCGAGSCPVGTHPEGVSPYGVHDMAGNLFEWVLDHYHGSYTGAPTNGTAWLTDGAKRAYRGGSFVQGKEFQRVSKRLSGTPTNGSGNLGFRCCRPD